jgi:hypothetical protein
VSSFAINGCIVFDPAEGVSALARAVPAGVEHGVAETRRRALHDDGDLRVYLLELVAALAREIRGRGDRVETVEVD